MEYGLCARTNHDLLCARSRCNTSTTIHSSTFCSLVFKKMRSWCLLLLLVVVTVVDSVPSGKAGPKVTFHNRGQLSQTTTRQRITFNSKGQLKLAIFNDLYVEIGQETSLTLVIMAKQKIHSASNRIFNQHR